MIQNIITLLASSVITGGSGGATPTEAAANAAVEAAGTAMDAAPIGGGLAGLLPMILIYVALFGALYFFTLRPQRKREKEMKNLQSSIRAGDNVVTSSGFYGKVMDVGENCFIVEFGTNRGIRIPVNKNDIVAIKTPVLHSNAASAPVEKSE